jgi:hypothetical protein
MEKALGLIYPILYVYVFCTDCIFRFCEVQEYQYSGFLNSIQGTRAFLLMRQLPLSLAMDALLYSHAAAGIAIEVFGTQRNPLPENGNIAADITGCD